jgi:hypothetical protein
VILRWGSLRVQFAGDTDASPPTEAERLKIAPMFSFEELQLAMRRDAGYPDTSLRRGDLLRLWVNDIDRYL